MSWKLGLWQEFKEGQIHHVTKRCLRLLHDADLTMEVDFITVKKQIHIQQPEGGFFEILKEYEKEHGVRKLLDLLTCGMVIIRAKKGNHETVNLQLFLRAPEDNQEKIDLFKEIISDWVKEDCLTFVERFFRLPKICEDFADRYLDNPLEQVLRKTFGFHFKYKVIIHSSVDSPAPQKMRESLCTIINYS